MPPKKKMEENGDDPDRSLLSVEDYTLPKSMILRLAKGVLPANTQIQKDALTAILKSTTVFVNYLASNADDRAQLANKKTIRPEDVFGALEEVEFGGFVTRVEMELSKYQDIQNNKRNDYRRRVKVDEQDQSLADGRPNVRDTPSEITEREKSTTPRVVTLGNGSTKDDTDDEADQPPAAKRARVSNSGGRSPRLAGDETDDGEDDVTISDEGLEYQSAEEEVGEEDELDDVGEEDEEPDVDDEPDERAAKAEDEESDDG